MLNIKNQPNPFYFISGKGFNTKTKVKSFYSKNSSDPFRIFVEFSIAILLANLINIEGRFVSILISLIGLIGLVVILYSGIFLFVFRKPPMILSDWSFTKVGIELLKNKVYLVSIFIVILLVLIYWGLHCLTNHLLAFQPDKIHLLVGLITILFLGYFNAISFGYSSFYNRTFYSPFIHFLRNINEASKFNFLLGKDQEYFKKFNLYQDLDLDSKPNIVIVNLESYGSINIRDEYYQQEIANKLKEKEELLSRSGLFATSAFSTPPMFAGGSWLSYTTLLYGTKVSDQNQYELLMKGNDGFDAYQSIFRYLKTQGYKNIYLCPLGGGFLENVDWDVVSTNLSSDQYITYSDLDYSGKTLNFMDLGVSAPDQYSINKAKESIDKDNTEPYSLFFCTLNSHLPFNSPINIEKNWSEIPNLDFETNDSFTTKKDKYKSAIKYQLDFIFDYIEKNKKDNTIYLLFGDHQPPLITREEMGWETIIHIIGKDKSFLETFEKDGFESGLIVNQKLKPIKHEGIMSLFMKSLFKLYGVDKKQDLPYLYDGIRFEK
jgi:hypothetical protein